MGIPRKQKPHLASINSAGMLDFSRSRKTQMTKKEKSRASAKETAVLFLGLNLSISAFLFSVSLSSAIFQPAAGNNRRSQDRVAAAFRCDKLWSGADGAYSIAFGDRKVLWLFGDTFIGTIDGGKRQSNIMIHNSIAIEDPSGKLKFYWKEEREKEVGGETKTRTKTRNSSFFPEEGKFWLWPGDGIFYKKKLHIFAKRVCLLPASKEDPFAFKWQNDELISIADPEKREPSSWTLQRRLIPEFAPDFHLGVASAIDQSMLYILCLNEKTRQAYMARLPLAKLESGEFSQFEFLKTENKEASWTKQAIDASPLWSGAAAEGSLCKTENGWICLYTENGMGTRIIARRALTIDSPWSEPLLVYNIPDTQSKRGFCYAAKLHPEKARETEEMLLSYSINPGLMEAHNKDPLAYFPHFVWIKLPPMPERKKLQESGNK